MHVDPPLKMLFDGLAAAAIDDPPDPDDHTEIRRRANETMLLIRPTCAEDIATNDVMIPVDSGEIGVRCYRPNEVSGPAPTLFFVHGGGWFQGNLETAEVEMGPLPERVRCVTVSVDYRLAPEHPFPIPLDDCLAAYRWMVDNAEALDVDTTRIAIAGCSAGGNLAAALCLRIRDEGLPMPIVQLLDVPALDLTMSSPSVASEGTGAGLTAEGLAEYVHGYVAGADPTNPYLSPLFADLTGLPPAVIIVAENDPIRDDGERYVRALHDAGVAAAAFRVMAQFHGAWIIPLTITSRLVADLRVATLQRAFERTLDPLSP